MASSLFGGDHGGIFSRLDAVRQMAGGNPDALFRHMMRTNPQFAGFVNRNMGKSPEQIAAENGIDVERLRRFL